MLKRSPGSKVSGMPSSTAWGIFSRWSGRCVQLPLQEEDLTRGFVLCEEERTLDGTPQESDVWTQATWLKLPFWFKQSLANFSNELDAVGFSRKLREKVLLKNSCSIDHQPLTTANDKTIADHQPLTTANDKTIADHQPLTTANDKTLADHQPLTTANDKTMRRSAEKIC